MRSRLQLPRGARLVQWTLALVFVPPLAALWSGPTSLSPRGATRAAGAMPPAYPYLRVVGVVPLRFQVEAPPAAAIRPEHPTRSLPSGPLAPPPSKEPAGAPPAAIPPVSSVATEPTRKVPDLAPPPAAAKAPEPLLLDENQAQSPDDEVLRYFRFPGADGSRIPPPAREPPSSATYRQQ